MAGEDQHLHEHQQCHDNDQLRLGFGMLMCKLLGYGVQFEIEDADTQHREYHDEDYR